jgi:hypothetical protein
MTPRNIQTPNQIHLFNGPTNLYEWATIPFLRITLYVIYESLTT